MTEEQKKEEIIKAWFAIDEWSGDVCTKLFSYKYPERKIYVAILWNLHKDSNRPAQDRIEKACKAYCHVCSYHLQCKNYCDYYTRFKQAMEEEL